MAQGKVILYAENKIKDGIDSAKKDLTGFEDLTAKVGKTLTTAFTVTAILGSLKALGKAAVDCFNEFAEGERRTKQLQIALNNNIESYTKSSKLIEDMNKVTLASKDDIENLVIKLAALGKSDAEIDKLTRAAVNLSNVTGNDLNSSFTVLNATYTGSTGKLGQLIPELNKLTKEQLEAGAAVSLVNDNFTKFSNTLAENNIPQKLKLINEDIGDIKEEIGRVIAIEFGPLIDKVAVFVSKSKEHIGTIFTTVIAVFENFPEVAKLTFGLVLDIIEKTFSWESLKNIFISLAKFIGQTFANSISYFPTLFLDVVKLMFTPIKTLGDYISDTLGKAFTLKFNQIKSPGEFIKDTLLNTAQAGGELVKGYVSNVVDNVANIKVLGADLSKTFDKVDFKGFKNNFNNAISSTLKKFESVPITPTGSSSRDTSSISTSDNGGKPLTDAELMKKFAPIVSGMYSASGYSFNKQFWDEFGRLPKYTDEELQEKFAPIKTGMYSAAGYNFDKQYWLDVSILPKYTDEQLQLKFAPIKSGMYSAAGYKFDRQYWDELSNLPKYTDEQLQDKFAPIKTGMYSAAGFKLSKTEWETFGNLPKYTDEELLTKFAPIKTGMYSAAGYKFDKQYWDEVGNLPKYTDEELQNKFAPIKTGMYSAAGYKLSKAEWDTFGSLPKYTDEELQKIFAPVTTGMYSAAGYKANKKYWEEFGSLPKYTDEQLQEKFAPIKTGMYSAAGYKLAKSQWEQFGNLPKYTDEELQKLFAPVTTGMYSAAGYKVNKKFWDEFGKLPKYTDEQLQEKFAPIKTGMYSAAGYKLAKSQWEQFDKDNVDALSAYYKELLGSNGQSSIPSVIGGNGLNAQAQVQALEGNKPSFFQSLFGDIEGIGISLKSAGTSLLEGIGNLGLSGGGLLDGLIGAFAPLVQAIAPLAQILFSANPLLAALLPVIAGFVSTLSPIVNEVLQPVFSALNTIGVVLAQLLIPIFEALSGPLEIVGLIITTLIVPVLQLLSPLFNTLSFSLQILQPILILIAQAFTVLMAPIKFVGDLLGWLGEWITTLGTNIGVAIYNLTHWLKPKDYVSGPGKFSSDAFSGLADRLDAIGNIDNSNFDLTATANTSSGASASYTGGNTITINIYQQAPIVGDGGMNEFARMIRQEFLALDYYNV